MPEFIRSPGVVRGRELLTDGPRYFPYRYRLVAPDLGLDVSCEPWVDAPAHDLPIEYWTGPVLDHGPPVRGSPSPASASTSAARPWIQGFEIAAALRLTVEHLAELPPEAKALLAYRAWEVESLALRDVRAARAHADRHLVPLVGPLPSPVRERLDPMVRDLVSVLSSRRRLP